MKGEFGPAGDGTEFYWNLIPSAWQMPIERSRLTWSLPEKPAGGEFGVSPRNVLGGVTLHGCDPGAVGVDERVEGVSG